MTLDVTPDIEQGRAYRTRELRRWSSNPARLARKLVCDGQLVRAAHGLYYAPIESEFGPIQPDTKEMLRAFLNGGRFLVTGPYYWNALALGSTAMFAVTLVYNHRRTGEFKLGNRRYLLRRVRYPENPPVEWFIVDLLQNHSMAGASIDDLEKYLAISLRDGSWNAQRLHEMAREYGSKSTLARVERCLEQVEGDA